MSCAVLFEEQLRIPPISSLADFRRWLRADDFPQRGRIDYIAGQIEINMSPEDLFSHNTLKAEIGAVLQMRSKKLNQGQLFVDRARLSCPKANLSVEPDVLYLSYTMLDSGRTKLVPRAVEEPNSYIEIEGPVDLVVEIVSDSSVSKDTKRLPQKYFLSGVREFWLIDARKPALTFSIHSRGKRAFVPVEVDKKGFAHSAVLDADYRLERRRDRRGWPLYELHERV
jgi:Uma2 family endonuclease